MLLLAGCMTMDSFFFNGVAVDAYTLGGEVIPAESVEEVTFDSEGNELHGVWALQEAADAPVYVYFHGNYANIDWYWRRVETYWSWGYTVFAMDYRGYGRSEGSSDWDSLVTDGIAAVDHVTERTGLPPEELVFHGLSLGGSSAIRTSLQRTPRVLITEDLFASADDIIDDGSGLNLPDGWFMEAAWDNVAAAAEVGVPYLILHAEDDDFIRSDAALELYAAAAEPKELWLAPGCDHDTIPDRLPDEYAERVGCWLDGSCVQ